MNKLSIFLLLLTFSFPVFSDVPETPDVGDPEAQVYFDSLNYNLYYIETGLNSLVYDLDVYYDDARSQVQQYVDLSMTGAGSAEGRAYNEGRADGAIVIFEDYLDPMYATTKSHVSDIREDLASARRNFNKISYLWGLNTNGLDGVISAISNNTDVISSSIVTNVPTCLSNLQYTVRFLRSVFPVSTNDTELVQALDDLGLNAMELAIDFGVFWENYQNLVQWLQDQDELFQQYLNLAYDRLNSPDVELQSSLRDMWTQLLNHQYSVTHPFVTNSTIFLLSDQVSIVTDNLGEDLRLSNEGLIALENLAVNQRSYLCLAELANKSFGGSNIVDVAWITNYLDKVQRPYYDIWNQTFNQSVNLYHPYGTPRNRQYQLFTNFIETASSGAQIANIRQAYSQYQNTATNYWERLEMYFLNLQGLIGSADLVEDNEESVNSMLDAENIKRHIDYSTNYIVEAKSEYASASNSLNNVFAKFNELASSFTLPSGSWDNVIRLTPTFELGGITIPEIYFNDSYFADIKSAVSKIFKCIWYTIFVVISFKLVLRAFYLLGKSVAHIVLVISTLLN